MHGLLAVLKPHDPPWLGREQTTSGLFTKRYPFGNYSVPLLVSNRLSLVSAFFFNSCPASAKAALQGYVNAQFALGGMHP
jgi:hypothetical protein